MACALKRFIRGRLGLSLLLLTAGPALSSEGGLQPLRNILTPVLESTFIPGYLITTFDADGVSHEAAAGITREDSKKLPSKDSLFAITWMAEPLVSLAVARLVQENRLSLDEEVSGFFPSAASVAGRSCEEGRPCGGITIRDLLRHTAGIQAKAQGRSYNGARQGLTSGFDISIETLISSNGKRSLGSVANDLVTISKNQPNFFRYSHSYEVLGRIIELRTERPLEQALAELVFDPLNMEDTFFEVPADKHDSVAQLYTNRIPTYPVPGQFRLIQPHPALPREQQNIGMESNSWKSPTLGLLSTASDLKKFLSLFSRDFVGPDGSQFLEKEISTQFFFTDQLEDSFGPDPLVDSFGRHGEGLSFSLASAIKLKDDGSKEIDYIFWWGLANTLFWYIPDQKRAGMVLTQHEPAQYNLVEELVSVSRDL
jgi:CubicO group peptidase (beta-lactamase class C family)